MNDSSSNHTIPSAIPEPEKLNFTTKLAYGAGDLGPAITANILVFYLLPFFTNIAGLGAGLAGSILMIGKISDAINDPIVGMLSDRTQTRWGRRLPWMLLGAIPFGLIYFIQWTVPHFSDNSSVNQWLLFAYYVLIGIVFNIFYTAVNLPYTALTPELTQDYNERTDLNSFRFTFSIGGSILSLILALIIFQAYPDNPSQQFFILGLICSVLSVIAILWCTLRIQEKGFQPILNQSQKKFLGISLIAFAVVSFISGIVRLVGVSEKINLIAILAILFSIIFTLFGISLIFSTPEPHLINQNAINQRSQENSGDAIPFIEQLKIIANNKPFLYVIGIYLCSWMAVQLTASILVYFVVDWMGLTNSDSSKVALGVQGTALIMLFFWRVVSEKFGKKTAYFMGMIIWIIAQAGLFLIQPGDIILMYVLAVLAGFGVSVAYLIPWSMVPDVIELDELRTGKRREGIFYGFMVLLQKFGLALGLFIVGQALQATGFIESVPGQAIPTQPESAIFAIRLAIGPLPTVFLIAGLVLAYFYPITRQVHAEIRLQLEERKRQ